MIRRTGARRSLNLNRLAVFTAVVEAGSLTGAAKRLGLTKAVVSSHLKKLEEELGVTLIGRTTRRMRLTDIGRELHERTQGPLVELMAGAAAARDRSRVTRGSVRVTAPIDFGTEIMAPLLVRIQQKNPGLVIDLVLNDHPLDFIAEGIDIAIRIGWVLQDSSYRAVRLGAFKTWVVAPASWASSALSIKTPADLLGRPFIAGSMLKTPARWEFGSADGIRTAQIFDVTMFANTNVAVRAAVESGGGFTILPDFAVRSRLESGSLIRLLDNWSLPSGDIQAIMPAGRHQSAVARTLFSSLQTLLRQAAR
ncbi:MAG: LysR family transcriptional regulator [Bradyrhizobium sp.]